MLLHTFSRAAALLVSVGLTVSGAALLARAPVADDKKPDTPAAAPKPGDFVKAAPGGPPEISVRGQLRPKNPESVDVAIPGTSRILNVVADQTRVKKGDVVVELDPAVIREEIGRQQFIVQRLNGLRDEAADILRESELAEAEGGANDIREQDRLEAQRAILAAELEGANALLKRLNAIKTTLDERLGKDQKVSTPELLQQLDIADRIDAAKVQVLQKQLAYNDGNVALTMFPKITAPRRRAPRQIAVRKAQERLKEADGKLSVEQLTLAELQRALNNTKIQAPKDGYVELANDLTQPFLPTIRVGSKVRERQKLFQIWDIAEGFTAEVKFPESYVDRLKVGQKVNVAVDAMNGKSFDATIQSIAPIPDPTTARDQPKVYTVIVNIDQPGERLRPGMTTSNRFTVELDPERVKPIQARVPRTAVAQVGKTFQVAIRKADGKVEWREVTLTDATDESAGIKSGLKPGEEVARDAIALLSDKEREEKQASYIPTLAESLRNTQEKLDARQNVSRATLDELKRLSPKQRETLMRTLADPQ